MEFIWIPLHVQIHEAKRIIIILYANHIQLYSYDSHMKIPSYTHKVTIHFSYELHFNMRVIWKSYGPNLMIYIMMLFLRFLYVASLPVYNKCQLLFWKLPIRYNLSQVIVWKLPIWNKSVIVLKTAHRIQISRLVWPNCIFIASDFDLMWLIRWKLCLNFVPQ